VVLGGTAAVLEAADNNAGRAPSCRV